MESSIFKQAAQFLHDQKNTKRWLMVFLCLAMVVAVGTVAALTVPGHAQTHQKKVLNCQLKVHEHTNDCYNSENELICGQADYVVHVHNDDCYEDGELVCKLPEIEPHKHTDECFKEEKVLTCELEESAGHQHSEECYTKEKGELTCGKEEHEHSDACYTVEETGEEGAEAEPVLTCGLEEHQHSDECYEWNDVLTCGKEEGEGGHTHSDACYTLEKVAICGKLELHTHDKDKCYDENGNLTCDLMALEEHTHSEDLGCFETVELTGEEVEDLNRPDASAPAESDSAPETDPADAASAADSSAAAEPNDEVAAFPEPGAEMQPEEGELSEEPSDPDETEPEGDVSQPDETEPEHDEKTEENEAEEPSAPSCYDAEGNIICGKEEHVHDASCVSPDGGELICGKEEHTHVGLENVKNLKKKTYEDKESNVIVTAQYQDSAEIPDEAELIVTPVTAESAPDYEAKKAKALETANAGDADSDAHIVIYNIGFFVGDQEVKPQDTVLLTVQFNGEDGFTPGTGVTVVRLDDQSEPFNSSIRDDGSASFEVSAQGGA